ncbi:MAG: hypothetical protein JOS17DRAFT_763165 [Linnemannia elongata]|nr:MAG: hypothetical protein JOS17DRAFT_763165 [Linnemannia elongata]
MAAYVCLCVYVSVHIARQLSRMLQLLCRQTLFRPFSLYSISSVSPVFYLSLIFREMFFAFVFPPFLFLCLSFLCFLFFSLLFSFPFHFPFLHLPSSFFAFSLLAYIPSFPLFHT